MGILQNTNIRGMSLRKKILLPFFLILGLLGSGATVVSVLLITDALSNTADERLLAFQQVVYREIKKQELLLANYTHLLQEIGDGERIAATAYDRLSDALSESNISVSLYPAEMLDEVPNPSLRELFSQALRSGKPRFRLATDIGTTPSLAVAAPLRAGGEVQNFILLQSPVDRALLRQISAPFHADLFLLTANGSPLASSTDDVSPPGLTPSDISAVLTGQSLFRAEKAPFSHRHLYSAIPLGTTDLIILSLELPMADLDLLIHTMATGSVVAITLALLLGAVIYYRMVRQVMAPVRELLQATTAVGEGNLEYRIRDISNDELGQVAESFNGMMAQLGDLYSDKTEREKQLALTEENLRHQETIARKNSEIEATNQELKTHLHELSALFQLNQTMTSTLDLNVLLDRILQVLGELLECDEMVLLLYNPGAEELEVRKSIGIDPAAIRDVTFSLEEGITGAAARAQQLLYVPDVAADGRSLSYKSNISGTRSMVSTPLLVKGKLGGVLNLHKTESNAFTENELKLIQAIANQTAIALENARLYEQARNLSNTDELTGIANRRHFQEILKRETAHAKRYHSPFCLIMIDIDHFKQYNDTHGHLMGDTVLKKVAAILLQNTRGIDLVGRFGGEEFIILLPKTDREGAMAAAEKLRLRVAEETFSGAEESQPEGRITLSLGVSEFPTDSKDIYELINLADKALYQAKETGRNRTVLWNAKHTSSVEASSPRPCPPPTPAQ